MANEQARRLRKALTDAELILWRKINGRQLDGAKFRRQHPLGSFVVDFVCLEKKLIVEVDGGHHAEGKQAAHDIARDQWLESRGYRVIRFWNAEVNDAMDGVLAQISELLADPRY